MHHITSLQLCKTQIYKVDKLIFKTLRGPIASHLQHSIACKLSQTVLHLCTAQIHSSHQKLW